MRIIIAVEEFSVKKRYLEYFLARELARLGHKVSVFTFGWTKNISRTALKEGFEVISLPHVAVVKSYHIPSLRGIAYVSNFIADEKPDVLHCQPLDSPLSLLLVWLKNIHGYRVVGSILTQLNLIFSPWSLEQKLLFSVSKILVAAYSGKKSEAVFAKNEELATLISRSYDIPQEKLRIVPLGSDPATFKFDSTKRLAVRKSLNVSENDVLVLYNGKIDPPKELDVLINALAPIINHDGNVKLLIMGEGDQSYVKYLEKLISGFGIRDKVIFQSWVDAKEIPAFYSASDIAVWPGLSSISIVDAASTGLPLVIARYPVETFAIENGNGFAFEIGNVGELRNFLEILIHNEKLRKEMGNKSRLLVEQKLNWTHIALQYLESYRSTATLNATPADVNRATNVRRKMRIADCRLRFKFSFKTFEHD
jgi:glycosyltransferase involved in cell wall biosynthesis